MFQFIKNYRKGKALEETLQFASIGLAAHISHLYESHADGKLYGLTVWDGLVGENSIGNIQEYRLSHALEIEHEVDKLMQDDEELRSIVRLTLLVKAMAYRAHGNRRMSENILGNRILKQWGFPTALLEPDDYAKLVESYLEKHAPKR